MATKKNPHADAYFRLLKTADLIDIRIRDALKPFGITHVQLNVLAVVAKSAPRPMALQEVQEQLTLNSPDLSRLVNRLVEKKLLKRTTCLENRRKVDISIAKKGRSVFEAAHLEAKHSVSNFFEKEITKKEAAVLFAILGKMKMKIQEEDE